MRRRRRSGSRSGRKEFINVLTRRGWGKKRQRRRRRGGGDGTTK